MEIVSDYSETPAARVAAEKAEKPFVLVLDIGTSSMRAAFYDARAREIAGTEARVVRGFASTPDGGAEASADELVERAAQVLSAAIKCSPLLAAETNTIAVSCFWHSLVGVDAAGDALTPVYGWADTRAGAAANRLRASLDEAETHGRTGCRFHSSYWPAKLLWLQTTRPEMFVRVRRWTGFSEFLYGSLCGEKAGQTISLSMASGTGLFDGHTRTWDATLLNALKLSSGQLPAINLASEQNAEIRLTGESVERYPSLGTIAGARWMTPVGDGATNNIGAGCTSPATIGLMIGTSGAMRVLFEGEVPARVSPSLWCYRADERRVVTGGALSDGGGLREWVTETMTVGDNAELVEAELAGMEPDAHGLTLVPCWAGERSTNWSAHARGAILGFTMDTRPVEILRAAMEAVAYRFALIERALAQFAPAAEIRASGGALRRSPAWTQVIADVTNRPVRLASVREASSRGVALLALEALGVIKSIDEIAAPVGRTFEPNPNNHARYMAGLERQQKLYKILVEDEPTARLIDYAGEQMS